MACPLSNKAPWFLIHTNPKQEKRTTSNLRAWNVETFFPQIRDWHYNEFTGERRPNVKPLFSRYIFARFDIDRLYHKVRYTRGVEGLVSFGDGPVEVDDQIIALIRSRVDENEFVKTEMDLQPGDVVMVMGGALKDLTGIFERGVKDSDRVVVLLNTLNYQARLQMDRRLLQKVSDSAFSA